MRAGRGTVCAAALVWSVVGIRLFTPSAAEAAGLKIVRPKDGSKITAGTSVMVKITVDDPRLKSFTLITPWHIQQFGAPRLETKLAIPIEVTGRQKIIVTAKDAQMNVVRDDIAVDVVLRPQTRLLRLEVEPKRFRFDPVPGTRLEELSCQIVVKGRYTDGVERDLTNAKETKYVSSNSSIVAVTATGLRGLMEPRHEGSAVITVSYQREHATIPVTVAPER